MAADCCAWLSRVDSRMIAAASSTRRARGVVSPERVQELLEDNRVGDHGGGSGEGVADADDVLVDRVDDDLDIVVLRQRKRMGLGVELGRGARATASPKRRRPARQRWHSGAPQPIR
ncbi:hypothetical protein OIE66_06870 [Nonomuraea sp. NBC_01738]|uniref:hypothetical protein n=1 Tax=Nonomuraea sp. NBC_01738 TaxID=2976003 RepID=UPI002E11EB1A|nr:hypothetical protein OIE66_06870 [Nonomuraea sp. NBC_01738]